MSQELLELLRNRYEATLNVLTARIGGARDEVDWATIEMQTRDLHTIAKNARRILLKDLLKKEGLG